MRRIFYAISILLLLACGKNPVPPPAPAPTPAPPKGVVILDFGHGGFDPGAVGVDTGVVEADLNLAIGRLTAARLEALGYEVLLTRADEHALGRTKNADMHARGELLQQPADAAVSIHMNKFSDRSVSGPMAFYQAGSEAGEALAGEILRALTDALGRNARSPNPANNFVTRVPSVPAALIECGFLSNPADERMLQEPEAQETIADAIAEGIAAYLEKEPENSCGTVDFRVY